MTRLPALGALFLLSCYQSHRLGDTADAGVDRMSDADVSDAGCIPLPPGDAGPIRAETVDLLLMVDNSNSMAQEQASLAIALPELIRAISSGDVDLDGRPDFVPVESLQVGVITADMGAGGFTVPSCARSDFGDDGQLRTVGNPELPGCAGTYPPFLVFRPDEGDDPDVFGAEVACLSTTGSGGCGFEQPLEAILKAVSGASGPEFFRGTTGHADGANMGFVRPDSVLTIVTVTDEDDCSAQDPDIFNPVSSEYNGPPLNLRCHEFPSALTPIDRYVEGLLALRARRPGRLVFASIVGVPPDLSGEPESTILADPRVEPRLDPTVSDRLLPSCDEPGRGLAFPPRRIVETSARIRAAGGRTVVMSICVDDFRPMVRLILERIASAAGPLCR